jgi:hypothetical protein
MAHLLTRFCVVFKIRNDEECAFVSLGKMSCCFFSGAGCPGFYNSSPTALISGLHVTVASRARLSREDMSKSDRNGLSLASGIILALIGLLISAGPAVSENASDWRPHFSANVVDRTALSAKCFLMTTG